MKLSIVIPIYNERNNISILVKKIHHVLRNSRFEIIVIDDSSTDGTTNILKNLKKKYPKFKFILRKKKERDLSKSCAEGFTKSKFDKIVVMDGDLQHDPKYIPIMLKKYNENNCDIVVGARDLIKNRVKSLSLFRQFSSYIIIKIFDIFFGKKTIDPMSGFFLFNKRIYFKNKQKLYLKGFKILADLIYSQKFLKINDVIIKFNYRTKGKSKLNFNILILLIKFMTLKFFKIL